MQLSSFYEEHFGFAWASLRRLGVAPHDLEDVTHDVFVVVHRRRDELSRASSPRGWLFGIVRRVAANYRRGTWRHRRRVAAVRDAGAPPDRSERVQDRIDSTHVVTRFLDGLAQPQRDVFVLFELQQMTAGEVAEVLEINPNTASARLRAARKAFHHFAADVRAGGTWDREATLARARAADQPPPEARQRVGGALAITLGPAAKGALLGPTAIAWAKAAVVTVALGGGTLGVMVGVASAMRPPAPPTETVATHEPRAPEVSVPPPAATPTPPPPAASAPAPPPRASPPQPPANKPKATPAKPTAPQPTAVDDLTEQNALLSAAHAALAKGAADEALRTAATYRKRFAGGPFATEMELVEIRGRCAAGDTTAAQRLGREFITRHPSSPHVELVQRSCALVITKKGEAGN